MSGTLSVSEEGVKLIQEWERTRMLLEAAKANVALLEKQLKDAEMALGKWLVPGPQPGIIPAHVGEQFNICIENGFLSVEVMSDTNHIYSVYWRKRPSGDNSLVNRL